jgi:methylated-DNA-[protein]-cysteine S-methyltransferase
VPQSLLLEIPPGLKLAVEANAAGLTAIRFHATGEGRSEAEAPPLLLEAASQLRAYFEGRLRVFDVPLDASGTDFQRRVWAELQKIPFGETRSYLDIARALGSPNYVRAVGAANRANPLPIVIPCHRVIGASGDLIGYGGGLELKKRLLEIEGRKGSAHLF